MNDAEDFGPDHDEPRYAQPSDIESSALTKALSKLHLLGDDLFLRSQAFNLGVVDRFITDLEYEVLRKRFDEERTPLPETVFLSAQSQMWIFAAYELLRTWRQRAKDIIKWHETGQLAFKLEELEKEQGYEHFGRQYRAAQIEEVIADPGRIPALRLDLKRTCILFIRLEAIRISLGKHEVWRSKNSVALRPGQGWINMWCGSLDFELENGQYSMGNINRRDIADEIRKLPADDAIPSDEEIAKFQAFMRGPPAAAPR